jgi:hypothetical protein
MRIGIGIAGFAAAAGLAGGAFYVGREAPRAIPEDQLPRVTAEGALERPLGWETWVMVGASLGLSYTEPTASRAADENPGMFHNVYMQPWAYSYFQEHAAFAEGTMFVLTMYDASRNADPARGGFYEGDAAPFIEVHLKRAGVDSTGWGFYNFGEGALTASKVPGSADCYSCHAAKADLDHVFIQFYPPIRTRLGDAAPSAGSP